MTSNDYLAQATKLTTSNKQNGYSNQERIYSALKCIGKDVTKVVKAEYVVDLFKNLRYKNIPLRTVSDMCENMSSDVTIRQRKEIMRTIMKYKQESARALERARYKYHQTFNKNKQQLINNNIYKQTLLSGT